ncbi:nose resistant to fluoxetine protein 6-like isoform X1 [Diorhabda carinulata]|uniref:nose resistant to fluoxetine protein 6-like isoform X1 n=2 Tax=Diorhabda carinulata TaxID=1163345 RepID=UPI0025A0D586|nr:nose resistant to fluoxetine protein 6-like isoform X1 [Diorhabda carinulata]
MRCFVVLLFFFNLVRSQLNLKLLQDYESWENYVLKNLNSTGVNTLCSDQLLELVTNSKDNLWKFFDATSKFPWTGLSVSSNFDWGNYDECLNINHGYSGGHIKGKYCLLSLLIPMNLTKFDPSDSNNFYKLSVCMPNACTPEDYNAILKVSLFQNTPCHTKDDLNIVTTGDIAMIIFLVVILTMMVISTWYDVNIKRRNKKCAQPIYLAFSVYSNIRKIIQTSKNHTEQIQVFNGIKTISMAWILAGHAMNAWNKYPVINDDVISRKIEDIKIFYITGSQLAVDTFFYMSGFLVAFIYMKQKSKPLFLQIKSFPTLIIYRYIRLTPAVAVLFFFSITIFKFMGDGPVWLEGIKVITDTCQKHYLSFFTYTQNYVNHDDICLIHTWYLSADMQLFVFSTMFLISLSVLLTKDPKNFHLVMMICLSINVFFIFLPLITKLIWNNYDNLFDTHSRAIDYTVGIMMGIFLRETKNKPFLFNKFPKTQMVNIMAWLIVLPLMGGCTILYEEFIYTGKYSHTIQSLFYSFYRPIWCIGLSWIVYACYYGYGGIISWILTRPILQTSKLSYCMYIVHALPIIHSVLSDKTKLYFSDWICFFNWCALFTISIIISFIWVLAFESPMITIEKLIFGRGYPKKQNSRTSVKTIQKTSVA